MTPKDVKDYYKNAKNFNKLTGMSHASLGNWLERGFIPENSQYKLESLTNGDLKAEKKPVSDLHRKKIIKEELLKLGKLLKRMENYPEIVFAINKTIENNKNELKRYENNEI